MPGTLIEPISQAAVPVEADPRASRAKPDFRRFFLLLGQLALLLVVFQVFRVEQFGAKDSGFFLTCSLAFGAFAVHYWLPFRLKEPFWIAVSLLGALLLLDGRVAVELFAIGAVFYLLLSRNLPYWLRVGLLLGVAVGAAVWRVFGSRLNESFGYDYLPEAFWPVFGSVFMFRMIIYLHDLRHLKGRPGLRDYLAYFFPLPNFYFGLFPVIDHQAMRMSYYRRDGHLIAQQGIAWICRGTLQLLLYRIVFYQKDLLTIDHVHSLGTMFAFMVLTYLLYLHVSGQFHIIIGLMHLFGYDLPETNRKYLLARSLTDFWRRINIYWKDFMVKIVYFPVYFRLRKKNEVGAKMFATAAVFLVTWVLHAYQTFWIEGRLAFRWTDTIFWGVLGLMVAITVWMEGKEPSQRKATGWVQHVRTGVSTIATFMFIVVIWSLWNSPTLDSWTDLIKRGIQ